MKIVFSKNNLPLSVFIRWLAKEQVSHMAIVFDSDDQHPMRGLVFHSNLKGVHVDWLGNFKDDNEIVYELNYPLSLDQEEAVFQSLLNQYNGKKYDLLALTYFIYRGIAFRLFGSPLPTTNEWQNSSEFLCTGLTTALRVASIVDKLPIHLTEKLNTIEDAEMITPEMVYKKLTS